MSELLFRLNYLNVEKLLLENYMDLELNETDVVILLKIYEKTKNNCSVSLNKLIFETRLDKHTIEKVMSKLYKNKFVSIDFIEVNGELTESYSVKNTILKIVDLLENRYSVERIAKLIEEGFSKSLSTSDLTIIREFTYSFEVVRDAIGICLRKNITDVKYLATVLQNNANK